MNEINPKKGFTLIELLITIGIIGILTTIVLALWALSSQNKAAIVSYKSSMKSLQTAVELCVGTGGSAVSGEPGFQICSGEEKFPELPPKCNSNKPYFSLSGTTDDWSINVVNGQGSNEIWNCKGCRIDCNVDGCQEATSPGKCY